MHLTTEQIVDALLIHREQCADCNRVIPPDLHQWPEKKLDKFVKQLIRKSAINWLLGERYEPEKTAALAKLAREKRTDD